MFVILFCGVMFFDWVVVIGRIYCKLKKINLYFLIIKWLCFVMIFIISMKFEVEGNLIYKLYNVFCDDEFFYMGFL